MDITENPNKTSLFNQEAPQTVADFLSMEKIPSDTNNVEGTYDVGNYIENIPNDFIKRKLLLEH